MTAHDATSLVGARYGEWVDADGGQQAGFLHRQEFFQSQVELAHAVNGFISADDVTVVAVPYQLAFIGHVVERALELVGTTLVSVGTTDTICPMQRTLNLMRRFGASAMVASAARALDLARVDGSLIDGNRHALRSLVFIGEACAPKRLERIAALWGARSIPIFGTASLPVIAAPCRRGELHLTEEWHAADLWDPSEARVASGGVRGELLLQPARLSGGYGALIATGELVELWPDERICECGDPNPAVVALGSTACTVVTAAGPISVVDVERVLFDRVDLEPDFVCEIQDGQFHVLCTPAAGEHSRHIDLERFMRDCLLSELGTDVALTVARPRTTEGESE